MRYRITKDSGESAYLQLYHQLKEDIAERILPYGTKLPSIKSREVRRLKCSR